ncbi:MAG: hypothetical protein EZS28_015330 [Streblomastix strix]|uniref:C2H2-type domain-containing protein n=1 Tax=Streblomastix strix TaxID=222440 RepID=A0A5J4W2U9_9EUKA|nr:MAG: hypothetical protein EZS28_015330 [Streblomastix strix]
MLQPNPGAGQQQQFQPPGFGQQLQHTGIYAQLPPPVVVQPPKIPPNLQPVGGVQSAQISANIQLTSQPEENDVQIPCEICKKMIRFSKYEEHLKVHQIEQEKKRIERENKRKLEDKLKQNQGKQLWGQGATFDKYQFNDMKGIQDHPEIISAQESKQDLSKTAQAVDPTLLKDALSKTAVAQQITPVIVLVDCPFCNQNLKSAEIWDHIKEHHKDKKHLYKDVSDILHFAIRDPNTGKLSINSTALIKCPYCQKTIQGDFEKHLNSSPHKQAYWVEFHNLLKHHYDLLSRLPNQFKAPEGYVFCPFCKDKHTKGKYEEHIVTNHKHKSKAQFFKLMTEIIPHMRRESTGFYVTHDMARLQCPFCNSLNNEYVEQHIWFYHKREEWAQFNQFLQSMEDSQ